MSTTLDGSILLDISDALARYCDSSTFKPSSIFCFCRIGNALRLSTASAAGCFLMISFGQNSLAALKAFTISPSSPISAESMSAPLAHKPWHSQSTAGPEIGSAIARMFGLWAARMELMTVQICS